MCTNEVYSLITPNLQEIEAVAIKCVATNKNINIWLMYGQNRLFTLNEVQLDDDNYYQWKSVVYDYCILPEADDILKYYNEYHCRIEKLNLI